MMILADFNPAILFFLLWGLLSWFTKKKKKQLKEINQGESSEMEPKADLFAGLQKLQDHLSQEVDIFPSAPEPVEAEEAYFAEDDEHSIEEPDVLKPMPEIIDETEQYVFKTNIKAPTIEYDNWLKKTLFQKSKVRKLMLLKEVLGEPRSLKPYTGDYFQS